MIIHKKWNPPLNWHWLLPINWVCVFFFYHNCIHVFAEWGSLLVCSARTERWINLKRDTGESCNSFSIWHTRYHHFKVQWRWPRSQRRCYFIRYNEIEQETIIQAYQECIKKKKEMLITSLYVIITYPSDHISFLLVIYLEWLSLCDWARRCSKLFQFNWYLKGSAKTRFGHNKPKLNQFLLELMKKKI